MAIRLGMNGHLAYNTAGAGGGGSWTTIDHVGDVRTSAEQTTDDVLTRARAGWHGHVAVLADVEIEFEVPQDNVSADLVLAVMRAYFQTKTAIGMRCYDEAAGKGWIADFIVVGMDRAEPIGAIMVSRVRMMLAKSATLAAWNGA